MSTEDNYAAKEYKRIKQYRAAYESEEAKNWIRSLSPAQRERAEKLGLLSPHLDTDSSLLSLDSLPVDLRPGVTGDLLETIMRLEELPPEGGSDDRKLHDLRLDLLRSFLMLGGNPRLNWMCLSYLADQGGVLEEYAKQLGMRKQAFHYHVRKLEKLLGVHSSRQRSEKARNTYRYFNKRKR